MNRWLALVIILIAAPAWADEIRPTNIAAVNSAADEDNPFSSVMGTSGELYFSRGGEIFTAAYSHRGWHPPKPFRDFQERGDYNSVFVYFLKRTPYPNHLFFATNSDRAKVNGRGDNFDIYTLVREDGGTGGFTVPVPLHTVSTAADEMHPWLTNTGHLYFSRKTKDGWRVFVAKRPKDDRNFEEAKLVDLPVGFHHPTLTPDGKTMYLQGPLSKDRWGLFRSTNTGGQWSKPEELTDLNNPDGPTGDRSPSLSRTGTTLFFVSDRPGGKGGLDIWSVPTSQLRSRP